MLNQELEQKFYFSVFDVSDAFREFGVRAVLEEVRQNPLINQQLTEYIRTLDIPAETCIMDSVE